VARRLGFGEAHKEFSKTARSVREAISGQLPPQPDAYRRTFLYLNHHGAATCTEADPHCTVCPVLEACPAGLQRVKSRARV
jgi:adenine-specific DNA glycosylase